MRTDVGCMIEYQRTEGRELLQKIFTSLRSYNHALGERPSCGWSPRNYTFSVRTEDGEIIWSNGRIIDNWQRVAPRLWCNLNFKRSS